MSAEKQKQIITRSLLRKAGDLMATAQNARNVQKRNSA